MWVELPRHFAVNLCIHYFNIDIIKQYFESELFIHLSEKRLFGTYPPSTTSVIRDDFLGPVCRFNVGSDSAVAPDRMGLQGVDPRGHLLQLLARTLRHHGRYKTSIIFFHQLCNILKEMFVNTTSS